jgi:hypothetical protein
MNPGASQSVAEVHSEARATEEPCHRATETPRIQGLLGGSVPQRHRDTENKGLLGGSVPRSQRDTENSRSSRWLRASVAELLCASRHRKPSRCRRHAERHRRAASRLALGDDRAAVRDDEVPRDGEAEARSARRGALVEPIEDPGQVLRRDASAGVGDRHADPITG